VQEIECRQGKVRIFSESGFKETEGEEKKKDE
jgi:hypothetical protein